MLALVVLATISGALSFQWTSSNILPNGTVVQVCDGDNLTLSWTFNLTSSEQFYLMEWRRSFQGKRTSLAIYHDEEFVKKPEGERVGIEFLPNAGLFLPSVTVSDSGYYEVHLSVLDPPRVYMYSQTALLQVSVTPATIDGSLHAYILPVGDFQAITGTWHVQLGCGKFISLGHPAVTVVWNTPSKQMVNSTSFTNNTFILNLANPVEEGDYSCLLERTSPAVECVDRHSPLRHEATVRVHEINTRLSLIEGGLEALREETINLSRPVKDLLDVISKVDVKVTLNEKKLNSMNNKTENLTRKVYYLENSNEQLTGVVSSINNKTENITSKVYYLENSNEQLTGVVSSINNKTDNLTSKVYHLENSTEQLTGVVSSIQRESSRDKIVMNNITYELQRNDKDIVGEVTKLHNVTLELGRKDKVIAGEVTKLHNMTLELGRKDKVIAGEVTKLHNMTYELQAKENDILRQLSKFQNENENNSVIFLGRLSELENYVKDLLRTNKNITNMFLGHETKIKEITAFNTLLKISGARIPVSCADVQNFDNKSGVHTLYLKNFTINVFCDQQTDNGGWTVIQRRQDGSVDFYRNWEEYEVGFGDLMGEFWIGLFQLHHLTKDQKSRLRVDLTDFDGSTAYAVYDTFYISGAADNYTLHVHGYRGNAGDSLKDQNLMQFSTYDRENDKSNSTNCAKNFHGAWWYDNCHASNLNGRYKSDGAEGCNGVVWSFWKNDDRSYKRVEMKIKS